MGQFLNAGLDYTMQGVKHQVQCGEGAAIHRSHSRSVCKSSCQRRQSLMTILLFYLFYLLIVLCKYWLCFSWVSVHSLLLTSLGCNYDVPRWQRRQSVPVWLSSVRTQMSMSAFSRTKLFRPLIVSWCLS